MHRSKQHSYSITSSAMESSPSGASLQSFSAVLARVSRRTHAWMRLRAAALQRDGYTCAVPGWGNATHVDHVVSRRSGGLDNLRSLCAVHDGQINEDNNGKRKSDDKPYLQNQNMF
jgi:5-methylcytosine-specific restriction endonuclease McrA